MSTHPSRTKEESYTADPRVHIGHVHLKVADLERALSFYAGVLGLEVTQRIGEAAAFLAAGDITIRSPSTLGKASADLRLLPARLASITPQSFTRLAPRWRTRCRESCTLISRSKGLPITESVNRFICAIPTTTE
jgi:hypothetical protein